MGFHLGLRETARAKNSGEKTTRKVGHTEQIHIVRSWVAEARMVIPVVDVVIFLRWNTSMAPGARCISTATQRSNPGALRLVGAKQH